jgi:hypothetical protein
LIEKRTLAVRPRKGYEVAKSIDKSDVLTFLGGAVAAGAAAQFVKSRLARKLAVKTMAGVLKAQDKATEGFELIYEEAQDVYAEAKAQAAASAKQAGAQTSAGAKPTAEQANADEEPVSSASRAAAKPNTRARSAAGARSASAKKTVK